MRAAEGWLVINADSHDQVSPEASEGIPREYNIHRPGGAACYLAQTTTLQVLCGMLSLKPNNASHANAI